MTERRKDEGLTRFGTELHRLLALIGLKRSALGERGYTYSLHKQICRGERPPTARALATLQELLDHRLTVALATSRRDPAKLERLMRHLAEFTWLHRNSRTGHWTTDTTALSRLWHSRQAPKNREGLPIIIEGTLTEPKMSLSDGAPSPPLRMKHKRLILTTTEGGAPCLVVPLSPAAADRLRRALSNQ